MSFRLLTFLLSMLAATTTLGQDFACQWIRCPNADSGDGVWFNRLYTDTIRPVEAFLTVSSEGFAEVLVNNRNISVHYPTARQGVITTATYDITRFLRADSNIIAVEYFPTSTANEGRQLSLSIYGRDGRGRTFAQTADETWICRPSARHLCEDGSAIIDGQRMLTPWRWIVTDTALWVTADRYQPTSSLPRQVIDEWSSTPRPYAIEEQRYFDNVADSTWYDYGRGFIGYLRATLRDAKPGMRVHFDDITYICNGQMDEQVITKFGPRPFRRVKVWCDTSFDRSIIQTLEAIKTGLQSPPAMFRKR